jgi:hypothetical protein
VIISGKGAEVRVVANATHPADPGQDLTDAQRIVACANALAGVADPAAAIEAARAVIRNVIVDHNHDTSVDHEHLQALATALGMGSV